MEDRIKKLITVLSEGTRLGKLNWQKTARENELMLMMKTGSVSVDSWISFDEDLGEHIDLVDIAFYNAKGEEAERHVFSSTDAEYELLLPLHSLAHRNHLKIDETLDNLLGEISSKLGG